MAPPQRLSADELLRKYATQATTALAVVIGISGVLMFYRIAKPQLEAMHEWLGMAFVIVAALHAIRHRRAVAGMMAQGRMRVLAALVSVAAIAFVVAAPPKQGNPFRMASEVVLRAPLSELAPLMGVTPQDLTARLRSAGVAAADPHQSIETIAAAQGADRVKLLAAVLGGQKAR